jgi:hypothetical protein
MREGGWLICAVDGIGLRRGGVMGWDGVDGVCVSVCMYEVQVLELVKCVMKAFKRNEL